MYVSFIINYNIVLNTTQLVFEIKSLNFEGNANSYHSKKRCRRVYLYIISRILQFELQNISCKTSFFLLFVLRPACLSNTKLNLKTRTTTLDRQYS